MELLPSSIDQSKESWRKCGWHLNCYTLTLWSGIPHYPKNKDYGPKRINGQHVHTGDSIGVVMDAINGELSSVISGVNYGVAFDRIPLEPLPCVALKHQDDSVEIGPLVAYDNVVNSLVQPPLNIIANEGKLGTQ